MVDITTCLGVSHFGFRYVSVNMECEDPLDNLLIAWDCMKAYYKANAIPYRFRYMNKLTMCGRTKGFPTGHSFKQSSSKHKTINIKFL